MTKQGQSWQDKVLEADDIWAQVRRALSAQSVALPQTPRRPDVRLIVNNNSGRDITFKNPGDHSGSKPELIPASGDSTAAMVMVKGETLETQYRNAETLCKKYGLATKGLSEKFLADMKAGKLADLVDEAYGPAPFEGQASKLAEVEWTAEDGTASVIVPKKGAQAAFGARAATEETVFLAQFHIYVKGTGTTPELVESSGMAIAVAEDWETKAETTRPIVPSVAKVYYGQHFGAIPTVVVHPDGKVKEIYLKNGQVIAAGTASPRHRAPKGARA
jgi:hypothetical protein